MGLGAFNLRRLMAEQAKEEEKKAASPAVETKQDNAAPTTAETPKTHAVGRKKKVVADEGTENK